LLATGLATLVLGTLEGLGAWQVGLHGHREGTSAARPPSEASAATLPVQPQSAIIPGQRRDDVLTVVLVGSDEQAALIEQAGGYADAAGLHPRSPLSVLVVGTAEQAAQAQQLLGEAAIMTHTNPIQLLDLRKPD
jgi:hypothetical protein